jgi:mRNA (2'-O-methyladenosine-N6-)-methyltransferase
MKTCKYVHYELDSSADHVTMMGNPERSLIQQQRAEYCSEVELGESQWINCDIRNFRMDILGQYGVIMADPPWDIHMELPYGTMADDEMRTLNVPALQTDGLIFLWVTGRAMELGRECLDLWGYKRVEEVIWVKTNQLQRIIRTGRTGHWLNHSKEHCLVGIKGNPIVNRNIDTDCIVAEVRETSRKPDEMYPLLERISPRTRKLELFARMHNTHAGWMSLGNQLNGVRLVDEGLRARFKAAYPEVEVQPQSPPRVVTSAAVSSATAMEVDNPFGGADESSKLSDTQNLLTTNP